MPIADSLSLLYTIIAIIFAVTVHEFSHAWMADRLGDPTARIYGRLTLNPIKHFDFFGTLALIFFGIGWGKPVPFNEQNLRFPKRDGALIALAGPMANLLTALVFAIPLKYLSSNVSFVNTPLLPLASHIFSLSIILFALNVLPFPPFDGSKIIGIFIPYRFHRAYENYLRDGMKYVILFILFDSLFLQSVFHFSILGGMVGTVSAWIMALISQIT